MDYTVFYYTYSTTSQTLAGAFGFLAAIVLFQIQYLLSKRLDMYRGLGEARQMIAESYRDDPERRREELRPIHDYLVIEEGKLTLGYNGLARSLTWTAGTIAACLILMPLTNEHTPFGRPWLAWPCLALTVAAAIYTILTYVWVIRVVSKATTFPPKAK